MDTISDSSDVFGSFDKLTKSSENRYIDHHRQNRLRSGNENSKRSYSTSTSNSSFPSAASPIFSSDLSAINPIFFPVSVSEISPFSTFSSFSSFSSFFPAPTSSLSSQQFSNSISKSNNTDLTDNSSGRIYNAMNRKITYSSSFTIVPTYECFNACTYCNFRTNVHTDDTQMMQLNTVISTLKRLQNFNIENSENRIHEILILSGSTISNENLHIFQFGILLNCLCPQEVSQFIKNLAIYSLYDKLSSR